MLSVYGEFHSEFLNAPEIVREIKSKPFKSLKRMSRAVPVHDIIITNSFLIENKGKVEKNNIYNEFPAECSKNRSHPAGKPQT